jgi:hypothetical protein
LKSDPSVAYLELLDCEKMQKTSSWADEADNDSNISDFPAPPPPPVSNAWKINDAKPKATGVVFEDFEVRMNEYSLSKVDQAILTTPNLTGSRRFQRFWQPRWL